eukprot:52718-Chlamydomonas_euryale.AAC.5
MASHETLRQVMTSHKMLREVARSHDKSQQVMTRHHASRAAVGSSLSWLLVCFLANESPVHTWRTCGIGTTAGPTSPSPTERLTHSPPGHTRTGPTPSSFGCVRRPQRGGWGR